MLDFNQPQPKADAFFAGQAAFKAGKSETPPAIATELAYEWMRGYRNARKSARFNATIAKRQKTNP